jgi:hypothetical protein
MLLTIFELPPFFLVLLLQEWISLKDVCLLDSSLCSHLHRVHFHYIVHIIAGNRPCADSLLVITIESALRTMTVIKTCLNPKKAMFRLKPLTHLLLNNEIVNFLVLWDVKTTVASFLSSLNSYSTRRGYIYSSDDGLLVNGGIGLECFAQSHLFMKTDAFYFGKFDSNLFRCGFGQMVWFTGHLMKYSGFWKLGDCKGRGIMTYANGDVYKGEWSELSYCKGENGDFIKEGLGTMTYKNGDILTGIWGSDYLKKRIPLLYSQ